MHYLIAIDVLGKWHPLWVHLPIGFVLFVLLISIFFHKNSALGVQRIIQWGWGLCFLSAFIAAFLGWRLSLSNYYFPEALDKHALWGWLLVGITFCSWLLHTSTLKRYAQFRPFAYGLSTLFLFLAGHFGGNLTHGQNYLFEASPKKISLGVEASLAKRSADSIWVYEDLIQPIFDSKCVACHNANQSFGNLNLNKGAFLVDETKKAEWVVPKNPYESSLFKRVVLPQDHPKFMPPSGTPLTFDELVLLEWWIINGAMQKQSLSAIEKTSNLKAVLERNYQISSKELAWFEKSTLPPLNQEQQSGLEQNNFHWRYLAANNSFIEVRYLGSKIEPEALAVLATVKEHTTWLNLSNVALSDAQMEILALFPNLSRLQLQQNPITENGLTHLKTLTHLENLTLYETELSEEALPILSAFPALRLLSLWNTNISPTSIDRFKKQNPKIEVVSH